MNLKTVSAPSPKSRYTSQKFENFIRITLPSKKNIFHILWILIWLFLWSYMMFAVLYFGLFIKQFFDSMPATQPNSMLVFIGIFFVFVFLALLALGTFGIHRLVWIFVGKEVIEADEKSLSVSQQTFLGKNRKVYSANKVKDLRVIIHQSRFIPFKHFQKLPYSNVMIAFDYEVKTIRFGLELEETEAKQIILAIKERLQQ